MKLMKWIAEPIKAIDQQAVAQAQERQSELTKPPGALGELEDIAIRLAGMQGVEKPNVDEVSICIFAGDHGLVAEGVSAFPQEVTTQMVANFIHGGAAISVLAKQLGAKLEVIDAGIATPLPAAEGLVISRSGAGTASSLQGPAMDGAQLTQCLETGAAAAQRAVDSDSQLFVGGEMGIGNTSAASALYCALLGQNAGSLTGRGTGLDDAGVSRKAQVIEQVLVKHQAECGDDALSWLRCVGGFEIAALTGAYIKAGQLGLPILVDGFISSAAALVAMRIQPAVNDWMFLSHLSAEQGHQHVISALNLSPILNLGLRLGEGSGAALAVPCLRLACATHNDMATFAEAQVAGAN